MDGVTSGYSAGDLIVFASVARRMRRCWYLGIEEEQRRHGETRLELQWRPPCASVRSASVGAGWSDWASSSRVRQLPCAVVPDVRQTTTCRHPVCREAERDFPSCTTPLPCHNFGV